MNSPTAYSIDLVDALSALPAADPAFAPLENFNDLMLGVVRFSQATPWECHPDGDELLHVVDGRVRVIVLPESEDEPAHCETLDAGSVFVLRKGLWHRQEPDPEVSLFFLTAAETTRHSVAEDPRREP